MKILLVDPPYERLQNFKITPNYPLGLAYLASYLNEKGHKALYLNLDWDPSLPAINPFSRRDLMERYNRYLKEISPDSNHIVWSEFKEILLNYKPDIVGISTLSVKVKSAFKLAEIVKKVNKNIITVFGGHHSQIFVKEILEKVADIDFIVLKEGEGTMLELANELQKKSSARFDNIAGLAYRDNKENIIFTEPRPLIEELDNLPYPSPCYYYSKGKFIKLPIPSVMASRGCPYNCNYCASNNMWGRRVRFRSPQDVISEIKYIIANQKERFLSFYDDCFTLNKKWLMEFCGLIIKEKLKINWQCITSINLVDEEVFKKIIQAGCVKVNIGIESGSERILKIANKNISLDVVRRIFKLAKKYKISTTAYIMLGFPTETEYDIRLTQKIIKEIKPNWVYCNVLIPLPGTAFYNWGVANKIIDPTNAWQGDTIKNIIMNITDTMPDEKFFQLVDETFLFCYKINSNLFNLLKRLPIKQYFINPFSVFSDMKRAIRYIKSQK